MKMWIDTEFNEYRGALISLALVAEDGNEWYGVRFCDDPGSWVKEHVMPHLNREPERDAVLRKSLHTFLCSFDSVHIIADWTGDIALLCDFLEYAPGERLGPNSMTFEVRRDLPDTAATSAIPHNALEDARALARAALEQVQEECTLAEFAERYVLELSIKPAGKEYIAYFEDCVHARKMDTVYGHGGTYDEALKSFVEKISGEQVIIRANEPRDRKQIKVPELSGVD